MERFELWANLRDFGQRGISSNGWGERLQDRLAWAARRRLCKAEAQCGRIEAAAFAAGAVQRRELLPKGRAPPPPHVDAATHTAAEELRIALWRRRRRPG